MKKALLSILAIALLGIAISLPLTIAVSETFEVPPLQTVNRVIDLEKNDRLSVSFSVSNSDSAVVISARVLDPQMKILLSFTNTRGDSFSYTAPESGAYTIGFVYEKDPHAGSSVTPQIKFSYDVESASSSQAAKGAELDVWVELVIVVLVAIFGIIVVVLLVRRSHRM